MYPNREKIINIMKKGIILVALIGGAAWLMNSAFKTVTTGNDREALLMQTIVSGLNQLHYKPPTIDDELSKKMYKLYLSRLDSRKIFFTQKDINQLKSYETKLDDEALNSTFEFFNKSQDLLNAALPKVQKYYEQFLSKPFDYSKKEYIEMDDEKLDYCKNDNELEDHWRKLIKYETLDRLAEKLDKQEKKDSSYLGKTYTQLDSAARAETLKAYGDWFKRINKLKRSDRLSDYINSFTSMFDPHTNYFEPVEKQSFDIDMSGRLIGIGARLLTDAEKTTISEIIPGGPAEKQGELEAGDIIIKVAQGTQEPVEVAGMTGNEVVSKIRGKKGTEVRLTVKKKSDGSTKIIAITRDEVIIDDGFARSYILQDDRLPNVKVGLIKLPKFYADFEEGKRSCAEDVEAEIEKLKKEQVNGIILDIRNNGGGSLRDVVSMSGLFIEKGPVVQVKTKAAQAEVLRDYNSKVQYDGPLAIMVNTASASASEIIAAALQDYGRAVIIGGKSTYGKGTVQRFFSLDQAISGFQDVKPLGDVKVTIQKFYRINGGSTQLKGVTPDIVLPDIYTYSKSGEKEMDYPMEWSSINPVEYGQEVNKPNIKALQVLSEARVAKSDIFKKIDENSKRIQRNKESTNYPLQLKEYRERDKKINDEAEQFKNLFTDIATVKIDNLGSDKPSLEKDSSKAARNKDQIKYYKKDPYLEEALMVLNDQINQGNLTKK